MVELRPAYPCDLQCHTTRSDGRDTPRELIEHAAALGMHAVAITDHDIGPPQLITLADGREVETVAFAAEKGVTLVPGYEFSTNGWVDEVHIAGYGLDWHHSDLQKEVAAAAKSKSDAYEELTVRLTEARMPIDWETEILHYTDAHGNLRTRRPEEVQRKHIFERMAARGYAADLSEAKLLVRHNPRLNVRRRKIEPEAAIDLIHRAGGTAVLLHPYLMDAEIRMRGRPPLSRHLYILELIEAGIDGLEARYTYDKTTYRGSMTPGAIEVEVRTRYGALVRFFTGGSDYHAGQRAGIAYPRQMGEKGLTVAEFEAIKSYLV